MLSLPTGRKLSASRWTNRCRRLTRIWKQDIKKALREHRGNSSVVSVALNALLAFPDRPFGFGDLIGREFNPETQRREPFLIAATRDLDENFVYAKEAAAA